MAVYELERFLDTIIDRPITDDGLAMRIFGRPQDLTFSDRPWRFDLMPGITEADLIKMHVIANIPMEDIDEVLTRLQRVDPND